MGPKTIEEARALPEITWEELLKTDIHGSSLFGPGLDGDDICTFVDVDGISKIVESTSDGYIKIVF